MTIIRYLVFAICLTVGATAHAQAGASASPAQPSFEQELREARYDLHVGTSGFTGSAESILESAIAGAQYVLIGEDHLTREIPQFTAAVCDAMAPQGLSAMAVEVGPQVARFVSASLGQPDRLARMARLQNQYPDSAAFLNMRQENDMVAHCAQAAHKSGFQLWGLDQEFIGSAGWLLDQILATHPGTDATAAINRLKNEEQKAAASAQQTGDPSGVFVVSVPDSELNQAAAVLQRDGNAAANTLFRELIESHQIYLKNMQDHGPESNYQRARLLKQHFRQDQEAAGDPKQRVLLKFGDTHLYKGFNELHQRDLGNYVAEIADGQGSSSLHICVLGAKGTHFMYAGYNRPGKLEPFVLDQDDSYHWIKPAIDNQLPGAWTMYDLRKLRFQKLGSIDPGMEREIYGYDLLIIIPKLTPADPVE